MPRLLEPDRVTLLFTKPRDQGAAGLGSGMDGGGSKPSEDKSWTPKLRLRGDGGHTQL